MEKVAGLRRRVFLRKGEIGFSLMEVLMVMAIIAILVSVGASVYWFKGKKKIDAAVSPTIGTELDELCDRYGTIKSELFHGEVNDAEVEKQKNRCIMCASVMMLQNGLSEERVLEIVDYFCENKKNDAKWISCVINILSPSVSYCM